MKKTKKATPVKQTPPVPANQRLRFFFKYWVLALLERKSGVFELTSSVNLNTSAGKRNHACLMIAADGVLSLSSATAEDIPDTYQRRTMQFAGDECSMWNDYLAGGDHLIVIGTGDIRNLTAGMNMDAYLWEWILSPGMPMFFYFSAANKVDIFAPSAPGKKIKK